MSDLGGKRTLSGYVIPVVRRVVRWGIVVGLVAFGITLILGSPAWVGSVAMVPTMLLAVVEICFETAEQLKKPADKA